MSASRSHPTDHRSAPSAPPGGAFSAYRWALIGFLFLATVEIFLAGYGVFALQGGASGGTAFDGHRMLANVVSAAALVVLVLAVLARAGRRDVVLSVVLLLVVGGLQMGLAALGEDTPFLGGLHALGGVGALGLAGFMHAEVTRRSREG